MERQTDAGKAHLSFKLKWAKKKPSTDGLTQGFYG